MKIVLLSGLCYAGKTYCADLLCKLRENYFKGSFAKALKDEVHDAGMVDKKLLKTDAGYKAAARGILQRYGQEKRAADKYYWAKKLEEQIKDNDDDGAILFVDDWRFKSEAEWFETQGYKVVKVRIHRGDYYKLQSMGKKVLDEYYTKHFQDESKQELASLPQTWFDHIILNNYDKHETEPLIRQFQNIIKLKEGEADAVQGWKEEGR